MRTLRVGIIGLGQRWRRRYRPALETLRDRFEIRAVCDEIRVRVMHEARRLGCTAMGPAALLARDDLDALLLCDSSWFGLWPVERACEAGIPVFCAGSLEADAASADALRARVRERGLPVMIEMPPRVAQATTRLRELLRSQLGEPRLVLCDLVQPGRDQAGPCTHLLGEQGIALLDWCAFLMDGPPAGVVAAGDSNAFVTLVFDFGAGRLARFTRWRAPRARRQFRCHVVAAEGSATLRLPRRLSWTDAEGRHAHEWKPSGSLGKTLLVQFHEAVTQGRPVQPYFEDAYRALTWLRAAAESQVEGRRIIISSV